MTKGRGRNGNSWITPEGNLNFTMFISSNLDLINLAYLPFTLSLALYEHIEEVVDKAPSIAIKWPNDILLNGKKVAGILIETGIRAASKKLHYINIGIGMNIRNHPEISGREVTSVNQYSSKIISSDELLYPLKKKILFWLDKVNEYQWSDLKKLWLRHAHHLGKEISTTYNGEKISGIFEDLGEEGDLIMRLSDGRKLEINSGIVETTERK